VTSDARKPERSSHSSLERGRGLLLGGAVGDALGAPVEFLRRTEILDRFGPEGITQFSPAYGRLGAITDDTQMTLFTLEGLIRAAVRQHHRGICHPPNLIDGAYRRWFATQSENPSKAKDFDGWLIGVPELWSRRAPGVTCVSALADTSRSVGQAARNDSKGAGGIMRVGPIGLYVNRPFELACEAAALTHGHVTGIVAAGWFADWISEVAQGQPFVVAAEAAWSRCLGRAPELDRALAGALALIPGGPAPELPRTLGEGWIAEEAAAIALWCVATEPDPMTAVRLAVNIDGDSDTTGSLVGQVLGAAYGTSWIPDSFLADLELAAVMEVLAKDAEGVFKQRVSLENPEALRRYPPG
jgi:ADP-ribosyl-[dinitrogen reductase] hydrolase